MANYDTPSDANKLTPSAPDPRVRSKRAQAVLSDFDREKGNRSNWEAHWQDVAEHVLPRYSGNFLSKPNMTPKGNYRQDKILDATGVRGLERFSAVVESMVTPRTGRWHRLRASDPRLMRSLRVKQFFGELEDILWYYRNSSRANFSSQFHEAYMSLGAFGTAPVFIDEPHEAKTVGLRYKAEHIGNILICENAVGIIDSGYRQLFMTADQIRMKFGEENLPPAVKKELDKPDGSRDKSRQFEIIHAIRPRRSDDPENKVAKMPWTSIYVSREDEMILREGGYFTFPMPTARYVTAPNEKYGRSVAMMALGAIKTLYEEKRTALKMGHRAVDPILLTHDDGILDAIALRPGTAIGGGLNAQGQKMIAPLDTAGSINFSPVIELMELERGDINDLFLVNLFQMAVEGPQMTATEVIARTQEKGALLAPTMGRLQNEFLGPTIERELDILGRQGVLPDYPPELLEADGEFEIEYDSPLSKAMRAEEAGGAMRYIEIAGMHAQLTQNPSMLDIIDPDIAGPDLAWIFNVPSKWLRTPEAVSEVREERAQQAAIQQATEAAPAAAGVMKAMQGMEKSGRR